MTEAAKSNNTKMDATNNSSDDGSNDDTNLHQQLESDNKTNPMTKPDNNDNAKHVQGSS